MSELLRVISLGAGVQSTTMALMAAHGEIGPMPDAAIFADTAWEPQAVYDHLNWLTGVLPYPVYTTSFGNLKTAAMSDGFNPVPFYTETGIGSRQCTSNYKIRPLYRVVREMLGGKTPKGGCEMWVGISRDEAQRMKPARVQYITNRWPLIELGMTRRDCLAWMEQQGYPPPPRSACLGCPFKSDAEWRHTRDTSPDEWAETLLMDRTIRASTDRAQYMHPSRKPLDQVDLSTAEDRGQLNMFNNECEGMCGV